MGDEVEDLRAVVSELGLALKGLQQDAADAEDRFKSSNAKPLEMMAALLKTNRKSEAQQKSVGSKGYLPQIHQGEMLCRHRWIAPTMAPGAEKKKVVVLKELIPLKVSLAVKSKIGA